MSRGDGYFKAGNYDSAKIEYLNVLRLDQANALPFQQMGIIWLEEGDYIQALPFLIRARDLAPGNVDIHEKLATVFLSVNDAAAARKEALAILKLAPDNANGLLLLCKAIRTPDDLKSAELQFKQFPQSNSVSYQLASADLLLRQGDLAGGEQAMRRAVDADPKSPDAHVALAGMYLAKKDFPDATAEFKTAADNSPPRGTAQVKYAEFELVTGSVDQAKAILAQIVSQTPDDFPAVLLQARIASMEKKLDDAIALTGAVLGRDPVNLDAGLLRSQLLIAKGDRDGAVEQLKGLVSIYPRVTELKYQLAQAYLNAGHVADATNLLNDLVKVAPDYADAQLLLADLNLRAGNAASVVTAMQALLKKHPKLAAANLTLAGAYRSLKQFDDAAAIFRQQIATNPNDPRNYFMLGMTLLDAGNSTDARTAFEKAQELAPLDLLSTFQLVALDLGAKDYAAALKRVQVQIQAQPKSSGAQYLLGKVYAAQKDWPHAEAALGNALALDPASVPASQLLISVYVAQNKSSQAMTALQAFVARNPHDLGAWVALGDLYRAGGDMPKATDAYEQALASNPDSAPVLNNLACIYAGTPDGLDKALALAQKARTLAPADPSVADTLAWILYKKHNYDQALSLLKESTSKPPVSSEIEYHFGMANYMMGNADAARTALQQALNGPGNFDGKGNIAATLAFLDKAATGAATAGDAQAMLKLQPGDPYAQTALGDAFKNQGDWANAAAAYQQALDVNPSLFPATLSLAELDAGPLHDLDKASQLAEKARELAPADPAAAGLLGQIAYGKGNYLQAYGLLQEALNSVTDDGRSLETLRDFAWAAYSQGNVADARSAMLRITKAAPSSPQAGDAQSFLALTGPQDATQLAAAEGEASKVLQSTPDYAPALMVRAAIRVSKGDAHGAADDYAAVLRRFPDFALAEGELARLYIPDPAHQDAAYDLAVKAHKALPADTRIAEALAEVCYLRKDYPYAVQLLQDSATRQPLDGESLFYLGMSLRATKAMPDSRQALKQAIAAGLPEPQLTEANRALADQGK